MKRFIPIFIMLALFLLMTGCTKDLPDDAVVPSTQLQETSTEPSETETIETAASDYSPVTLYAVSVPSVTEESLAEDGNLIYSYSYQNISMIHPDEKVADKIIVDFLNRQDSFNQISKQMHERAEENYTASSDWLAYKYDVHFDPARIDQSILSFYGTAMRYSGGIHPEYTSISANYDMLTGDTLTLASILNGSEKAKSVSDLAIEVLKQKEAELSLFTGYSSVVESLLTNDPSLYEAWYFTDTGLCFYFSPYEIAPYSSGVVKAEIPYEALTGLLYDGYFPAEQEESSGNIVAQKVTDSLGEDALPYQNMVELIVSENGEQFILSTDGLIRNVSLEYGNLENEDAFVWGHRYCAFRANAIGKDNAIIVQTDLPENAPQLKLTYTSGGEQYCYYICQNMKDGSVILMTESELLD